jgi:hypothetical protein
MKTSKNSRLALSIAGALCSLPLFLTNAHAFGGPPGGPFSNGSYFPNDGTFSAVVRGTDTDGNPLVGTVQFSTTKESGASSSSVNSPSIPSSDGGVGSSGVSSLYYLGWSFSGNTQGSYDPSSSSMTINFQSDSEGQGQKSFVTTNTITSTSTNATSTITTETSFFDSNYLSGYAECQTSNSFPNQKFSGSGEAQLLYLDFTQNAPTTYEPVLSQAVIPISVSGVRLSNTSSSFNTANVRPPSVVKYTTGYPSTTD